MHLIDAYTKMYFIDYHCMVMNCEGKFKDILYCRYVRLTQSKTKENKEYWSYGNEILLDIHKDYLRDRAEQKSQIELDDMLTKITSDFNNLINSTS